MKIALAQFNPIVGDFDGDSKYILQELAGPVLSGEKLAREPKRRGRSKGALRA
jgi:hypothetical protein